MKDTRLVFAPSKHAAFRKIKDTMVVVNPITRSMVTLNETATVIWEALDGTSVEKIGLRLALLFEVSLDKCTADALRFLREMEERGLVVCLSESRGE